MRVRALWRFWAVACGLSILSLFVPLRRAQAEQPSPRAVPAHVLGIDSDDAEDQADALTGAIRSRVRSAPGWSLQETQHSLGMLTAALRCPAKPDAACLQKIGDQLRTDRFIWGVVTKAPGNQITAEIHLWARGKPDSSTRETYSDNLKDQNDETLRKIATRILEKISGSPSTGTVTIHAGDSDGVVFIDGQRRKPLEHGSATIDLPPGTYQVEVRAQGFAPARQDGVIVAAGQDTSVPLKLSLETAAEATPAPTGGHTDVKRIVGWSLIGVGAVAGIVAGVEAAQFFSAKSDLDNDREQVPSSVTDVCAANVFSSAAVAACSKFNDAQTARIVGVLLGIVGAGSVTAGVVLLLTDHPKEEPLPNANARARSESLTASLRVLPYASPRGGGGLNVGFTF
jgi:hypothetical protein